ncbi:MAG: hypothetical protein CMN87_16510 [Stappia sp.]|jgi:uncharacterized membrane protein|uniref:DUF1036 domain-containing protein n=1 Tax=Stappia sp. TaxID=1870903 RepID=UPI000C4DD611|nr:DUF1036 domain-containing protein [Stappia sp.]MAA98846.1 hypothetical protein [Stappia sp.]MBM21608.1 hypothetical protein [Stappia sp.]
MMKKAAWLRRSSKDRSNARPSPRWTAWTLVAALLATLPLSIVTATPAAAELRLCNKTESQVGVAIGYREDNDWVTEGWWNLPANTCETLVAGGLVSRFYYIYAVDYDQFGEWGGRAFMCTREKEFTIKGIEDCVARGYERTGFFEIDTGEQSSWTVQLTEPVQAGTGGQ